MPSTAGFQSKPGSGALGNSYVFDGNLPDGNLPESDPQQTGLKIGSKMEHLNMRIRASVFWQG
jgi:hypothetical protein